MPLKAWSLEFEDALERSQIAKRLRAEPDPPLLLDTCQRFECFGHRLPDYAIPYIVADWPRQDALERLARIAAGLESRILGELEILGQVRNAYKAFKDAGYHRRELDPIFQRALALGRKARRMSGIDSKLTSVSGIAARELLERIPQGTPVAVIGSGSLASSAARYLYKRGKTPLRIMSRCPENAIELAMKLNGFGTGLDKMADQLREVHGIVCATAAPHPVLFAHHLEGIEQPLSVIDLGEPRDCDRSVAQRPGVDYLDLLEIEKRAGLNSAYREECAATALRIIQDGAAAWACKN